MTTTTSSSQDITTTNQNLPDSHPTQPPDTQVCLYCIVWNIDWTHSLYTILTWAEIYITIHEWNRISIRTNKCFLMSHTVDDRRDIMFLNCPSVSHALYVGNHLINLSVILQEGSLGEYMLTYCFFDWIIFGFFLIAESRNWG
jgi:hypothetical protein